MEAVLHQLPRAVLSELLSYPYHLYRDLSQNLLTELPEGLFANTTQLADL